LLAHSYFNTTLAERFEHPGPRPCKPVAPLGQCHCTCSSSSATHSAQASQTSHLRSVSHTLRIYEKFVSARQNPGFVHHVEISRHELSLCW